MGYNVSEKYHEIFEELNFDGINYEVPTSLLRKKIKEAFNLVRERTTDQHLKNMELFGFIRNNGGVWVIIHPDYRMPELNKEEEEKKLDEINNSKM